MSQTYDIIEGLRHRCSELEQANERLEDALRHSEANKRIALTDLEQEVCRLSKALSASEARCEGVESDRQDWIAKAGELQKRVNELEAELAEANDARSKLARTALNYQVAESALQIELRGAESKLAKAVEALEAAFSHLEQDRLIAEQYENLPECIRIAELQVDIKQTLAELRGEE